MRRIESLNFLRGVASVAVCLFHISIIGRLESETLLRSIFQNGHFGVEVFFIVSGFVIPYSMYQGNYSLKKIGIFFKKRLTRLEPPYLASIGVVLLTNYIFSVSPYYSEDLIHFDLERLFFHFGYLNSIFHKGWFNQVYWTLAIEFQFYILISLFYWSISGSWELWLVTCILLVIPSSLLPDRSLVFLHLPFFLVGTSLFRYNVCKDSKGQLAFNLIAMLVMALKTSNEGLMITTTILFTVASIFLIKKSNTLFDGLGNISYSLYLVHIPVCQRVVRIGVDYVSGPLAETALIFIAFLSSLIFSFLFYQLVERPSKRLASSFRY